LFNHIARKYEGKNNPAGVKDFGADDDSQLTTKEIIIFITFQIKIEVPDISKPLNGEENVLSDAKFEENPAKWTGNGSRLSKPDKNDWYETVKVNYGIRPDGSKDFPELPADHGTKSVQEHFKFWEDKDVPDPGKIQIYCFVLDGERGRWL
jgi:hypothetical protein